MVKLIEARERGFKYYYPLTEEEKKKYPGRDFTHIKVEVCYTTGGMNYFSGTQNPRGYKVVVSPVSKGDHSESYILLGGQRECGGYVMVEVVSRYNARRLAEHAEALDGKVDGIARAAVNGELTSMIGIIKEGGLDNNG